MRTTADKLNRLKSTKEGIRQEINRAYGGEEIGTSDTFNSYIQKLEEHPFYVRGLIDNTVKSIKVSSVTTIREYAFAECTSLVEASFPNVTSIERFAFDNCSNLTTLYIGTNTSTVCSLNFWALSGAKNLTNIYVPASLVDSYKSAEDWSSYADKIKAAP